MEIKQKTERLLSPNHGSSTGEEVEVTSYYNPITYNWEYNKEKVLEDIEVDRCRKALIKQRQLSQSHLQANIVINQIKKRMYENKNS